NYYFFIFSYLNFLLLFRFFFFFLAFSDATPNPLGTHRLFPHTIANQRNHTPTSLKKGYTQFSHPTPISHRLHRTWSPFHSITRPPIVLSNLPASHLFIFLLF